MLLRRRPHSSRRLLVTLTCTGAITLFHPVEGFPVLVKKTAPTPRVIFGLPPLPIQPNSDARWFDDGTVSALTKRSSSSDVVHDKVFIPAIVSMGVLVIFCIYCCYRLIISRENVPTRGAYNDRFVPTSQHAVGRQESGHGIKPLSRGLSKTTRGSIPSTAASVPASPSVTSNTMLENLQRRREEQHRREMQQQQDPYQQYISANQGYSYPQPNYQYTPQPSASGLAVLHEEGVQPLSQLSHNAHVPIAQSPTMNVDPSREQHRAPHTFQQPDPRQGVPITPSTQTSSDVLSYMTPPEARQPPLPNTNNPSRPQNQDYFSPQHPAAGSPLRSHSSSTHGNIAHSGSANYSFNPASRDVRPPSNLAHAHDYPSQPPGYSTTETRNNVQGNVTSASTTPSRSEKPRNRS